MEFFLPCRGGANLKVMFASQMLARQGRAGGPPRPKIFAALRAAEGRAGRPHSPAPKSYGLTLLGGAGVHACAHTW